MQIKAIYDKTIFETAKDGIIVALYNLPGEGCKTVKGTMLPSEKGIVYAMDGEWIEHPKYGKQFRCDSYVEDISTEDSIIRFLSSPLIKGIGPVLAKRIVDKFGTDTINIMDNNIEEIRLAKIKGLSPAKFEEMKKSYESQRTVKEVIMLASKHGWSTNIAIKCYKEFKEKTIKVFKETPYELSKIEGISFPTADKLGWLNFNVVAYEMSRGRFQRCAYYVLYGNEAGSFSNMGGDNGGSNCMEINAFGKVMYSLLKIKNMKPSDVSDMTCELVKEKKLKCFRKDGKQYIMPMGIFLLEEATANALSTLSRNKPQSDMSIVERAIKGSQYELSKDQQAAVRNAFANGVSLIIGVPGSGKTTTVNTIARAYKRMYKKNSMYFLAPSGRAAAHIKETLDVDLSDESCVSTIHSALEITTDTVNSPKPDEEIKIENALVVVDEISMLDSRLAYQLFSSLSNCIVVLCGDDEQLPSVCSGAVLRDLIRSNVCPITVLSHVYRQEAESDIYKNLYKVREGNTNLSEGNEFHMIEESDPKTAEDIMIDLYLEKIKEYGIENVMLLSPMKDYEMGVRNLNTRIQEKLHPLADSEITMKYAYEFRAGDIVMQLKNDYEDMTMNGDIGVIIGIMYEENEKIMLVKYPHTTKKYTKENIDQLGLAYAYTIHKAQGSEAKCVIMCAHNNHSRMLKRNLFYTGMTRAKKEIFVIGQKSAVNKAITTVDSNNRITTLETMLDKSFGHFFSLI